MALFDNLQLETGKVQTMKKTVTLFAVSVMLAFSFQPNASASMVTLSNIVVKAPVTGAVPTNCISGSSTQYTGTVLWNPSGTTFVASTVYTAMVALVVKSNFTFSGLAPGFFVVTNASTCSNPTNSWSNTTITAIFSITGVATNTTTNTTVAISIIDGVTEPIMGAVPVTNILATAQYVGTVSWSPNDPMFAGDTYYTATITLTASPSNTFVGVGSNFFTVAEAKTVMNDANSGVVKATFLKTLTPSNHWATISSFTNVPTISVITNQGVHPLSITRVCNVSSQYILTVDYVCPPGYAMTPNNYVTSANLGGPWKTNYDQISVPCGATNRNGIHSASYRCIITNKASCFIRQNMGIKKQ